MILSDEEHLVVRGGLAAADLLANEAFTTTIKALMLECFATFTETQPAERDRREHTYNLYQGLKAIEAELNARILRMEELKRKLDAPDADIDADLINDNDLGD
jgi:hypothetical protein